MIRFSKLKTTLFAFCCLAALNAFSQQTINVAGNTARINGMTFDYSIGEMTLISTERNAGLIVTQGLLQPHGSGSGATSQPGYTQSNALNELIKVYPNPTQNILYVESIENADAEISYQLFDATGKTVLSHSDMQKKGLNKFSLDLQSYAAGSYYLMIRKLNAQGEYENYSYKIQKTN